MPGRRSLLWSAFRLLFAVALRASGATAQEVHFAPEERLDAIDAQFISGAKSSIDFASYSLMDSAVLGALNAASRRGVAIRIVLDPRERLDFVGLGDLSDNVRIKRSGSLMHLKAYTIDGKVASVNRTMTLSSFETPAPLQNSTRISRKCGMRRKPMIEFERAIKALEPN